MTMNTSYTVVNSEVIARLGQPRNVTEAAYGRALREEDIMIRQQADNLDNSAVDQDRVVARRSARSILPFVLIVLIAACHFLLVYAIGSSPRFENSTDLDPFINLLLCPMFLILVVFQHMNGAVTGALMVISSLIWGVCFYLMATWFNGAVRRKR